LSAFPRLLFVTSAAFNRRTGGGITFGNLFAGWPKDRLATAHNDPEPTTSETCERYYRLGAQEIRRWGPLETVAPAAGSDPRRKTRLLRNAKALIFGNQLPDRGILSPALERWIDEFRPQLLYSILGGNAMMELVAAIERRFALPLVVHMMDDWPALLYRGGLLGFLARGRMQSLLKGLVGKAHVNFGICDDMCAAYERRYGVPFRAFQNAVDLERWSTLAKADLRAAPRGEVVYIGSILPFAQLESLIDCCRALAGARLSIYSPDAARHRDRLALGPEIALHDTIADDEAFFRRLARADALLLPVNFDADAIRLLRYSMPTKVPAYLASGTPILAYGPDSVAQIRYAREAQWAHVVSRRAPGELAAGLKRVLGDVALRERLSANARRLARERHDAAAVRTGFQQALKSVNFSGE